MGFERVWDSSCPRTWLSWVADGVTWVIRDLPPEDDEEAVRILVENLCPDETLCILSDLVNEPASVSGIAEFWRGCLAKRMSIGCYEEKDGNSKLVALTVCVILCQGEHPDYVIKGKAWNNVYEAMKVCDKVDAFKLLGVNKILYGQGLVVSREYRGHKLGSMILAAREPLALYHGVTGSSTIFSGPALQKSAQRAGYFTALTVTLKELAEAGLDYPPDENRQSTEKHLRCSWRVIDEKVDVFELLGVDKLLHPFGLVVLREYRGAGLASKILAAREPLALHHCITATSTIFTGLGSQKAAARVGFSTSLTITLKDLAEAGLDYPRDEKRCIKLMVKKYVKA